MQIHFYKYQGTGNDFILIDNRDNALQLTTEQVAFLCDRRFGIGADGLILLENEAEMDFKMVYYNSDGKESSMCGNGGRCVVAFAEKMGIVREKYTFLAIDGVHEASKQGEIVKLRMGKPKDFRMIDTNTFWLNTGSPHYVQIREENLADLNVKQEGAKVRYSPEFAAEGTNVNFMNLDYNQKGKIKVRTYERGVEDETLSCGTGVTACAYTYIIWNNSVAKVEIETLGGNLSVEVKDFHQETEEVWLVGAATFVFSGKISL